MQRYSKSEALVTSSLWPPAKKPSSTFKSSVFLDCLSFFYCSIFQAVISWTLFLLHNVRRKSGILSSRHNQPILFFLINQYHPRQRFPLLAYELPEVFLASSLHNSTRSYQGFIILLWRIWFKFIILRLVWKAMFYITNILLISCDILHYKVRDISSTFTDQLRTLEAISFFMIPSFT